MKSYFTVGLAFILCISFSSRSFAISENRLQFEKKQFNERKSDIELLSWSNKDILTLKFLGPENSEFHKWYEIQVELTSEYPFKPCSIVFIGERPQHWFYFKYDNLSKNQDLGLFYGKWSPSISIVGAIDMIKDSLLHPEKYEDSMKGQYDEEYRRSFP
jgi:ubiquitin-protein ligase